MKFATTVSVNDRDNNLQKTLHLLQQQMLKAGWHLSEIGVPFKDAYSKSTIPVVFEKTIIVKSTGETFESNHIDALEEATAIVESLNE